MIQIRDLTVRYGRFAALDGVTFDVAEGAVFALMGRNGAGKSTLLRTLLGLRRPDRGEVRVAALEPWRDHAGLMSRLAFTPEVPDAPPEMSVDQLARFAARFHPDWDGAGFTERMRRFEIAGSRRFGRLSRGQKGLVHLALALAQRPRLLVLDDPTLGLDPVARRYVFDEVIGELADRGTTILMATHDLEAVERLSTHVALLQAGRCRLCGETESLRRDGAAEGAITLEELFFRGPAAGPEAAA
jgi:ABC-2 type transport system ATP-binding protein